MTLLLLIIVILLIVILYACWFWCRRYHRHCVGKRDRFAYVLRVSENSDTGFPPSFISVYSVNDTNGNLTFVEQKPEDQTASNFTADLFGRNIYVANIPQDNISQFAIESDGTVSPLSPLTVAADTSPIRILIHPTRKYAYVGTLSGDGSIIEYNIDATEGRLVFMGQIRPGVSLRTLTLHPIGSYLYSVNTDEIVQHNVGPTGELTLHGAPVSTGNSANDITVTPSGNYVYVTDSSLKIYQYSVGAGGEVSPLATATIPTDTIPFSIVVDPFSRYAYVSQAQADVISQYTIGTDGNLTPMTPATVPAGTYPNRLFVDQRGRYLYCANSQSNTISQFQIGTGGALVQTNTYSIPDKLIDILII